MGEKRIKKRRLKRKMTEEEKAEKEKTKNVKLMERIVRSFEEVVESKKLSMTEELIVIYKAYNALVGKYQVLKREYDEAKRTIAELNKKLEEQISDEDRKTKELLAERRKAREFPCLNGEILIPSDFPK